MIGNRALLLSGGSALGAVDQVVMENLVDKYGYQAFRTISGVSVGALNGILFAQKELPRLREIWESITDTSFFMNFNWFNPCSGLYTLEPLKRHLQKDVFLSCIENDIDYRCGVFDLQFERYWNVSHKVHDDDHSLIETILASCAQPVLMAGRVCKVSKTLKRYCVDGGLRNIIPDLPDWKSYDAIDVILTSPIRRVNYKPINKINSLSTLIGRFIESQLDNTIIHNIHRLELYGTKVPVTLYAPKYSGYQLDASPKTIKWRLEKVGLEMWNHPISLSNK